MKREEWIRHKFGDVTPTFSNGVVTASDLSSFLEKIETDLSLVHAAYYTDDECIERIADWIAGRVRSDEVEDAPSDAVRLAGLFSTAGALAGVSRCSSGASERGVMGNPTA